MLPRLLCLCLAWSASPGWTENSYTNVPTKLPTRYVRPKPPKGLSLKPIRLFSYQESACQELPQRIVWTRQKDPLTGEMVDAPVDVSSLVVRACQREDIDPLVVEILMGQESAYNPQAQSPAGAQGLMQLMPETAKSLGVTDIFDVYQNVDAGVRYLAMQWRQYGELQLALAAYNAGPTAVSEYGGIPPYDETIHYVSRIAQEYCRRRKTKRA
jgi:hypothetical protein